MCLKVNNLKEWIKIDRKDLNKSEALLFFHSYIFLQEATRVTINYLEQRRKFLNEMIEIHKENEPIFSKKAHLNWKNKLDDLNNELLEITKDLNKEYSEFNKL